MFKKKKKKKKKKRDCEGKVEGDIESRSDAAEQELIHIVGIVMQLLQLLQLPLLLCVQNEYHIQMYTKLR